MEISNDKKLREFYESYTKTESHVNHGVQNLFQRLIPNLNSQYDFAFF